MKILLLTQYFPPETGAPQNRLFELALRLQQRGIEMTVLTAMPNYPQMEISDEYKGKKYVFETMSGLPVHRCGIYVTQNRSVPARLLNYFSFVWTSWRTGRRMAGEFDYVLCESPPLFLGISAWLLCKQKKAGLIFNVSDLWPESAEKLGLVTNRHFLKLATKLEEFLYRKATLITGQTQGIVENIQARFPTKQVYWLPNGVDLTLYNYSNHSAAAAWRVLNGFVDTDFIFLYAGILGYAQGLEVVLRAAARLTDYPEIKFVLLGSGPEKERLEGLAKTVGVSSVVFLPGVPKLDMPGILSAIDVAVIPLKRLDLFKGAIPSKIFETLAMKKPILLGVEGEAKKLFIETGCAGLAFIPEDDGDLASKALEMFRQKDKLSLWSQNGYNFVKANFTRDQIASAFGDCLEKLA
jgi:glycosyltransferase involved in cell wall biosynthesis